jgi:hypothetical protein
MDKFDLEWYVLIFSFTGTELVCIREIFWFDRIDDSKTNFWKEYIKDVCIEDVK